MTFIWLLTLINPHDQWSKVSKHVRCHAILTSILHFKGLQHHVFSKSASIFLIQVQNFTFTPLPPQNVAWSSVSIFLDEGNLQIHPKLFSYIKNWSIFLHCKKNSPSHIGQTKSKQLYEVNDGSGMMQSFDSIGNESKHGRRNLPVIVVNHWVFTGEVCLRPDLEATHIDECTSV